MTSYSRKSCLSKCDWLKSWLSWPCWTETSLPNTVFSESCPTKQCWKIPVRENPVWQTIVWLSLLRKAKTECVSCWLTTYCLTKCSDKSSFEIAIGLQANICVTKSYLQSVENFCRLGESSAAGSFHVGPQCCKQELFLSLIHIWRCRRYSLCRSRWSPYH